jgi:hypothetical protein
MNCSNLVLIASKHLINLPRETEIMYHSSQRHSTCKGPVTKLLYINLQSDSKNTAANLRPSIQQKEEKNHFVALQEFLKIK